LIPKDLQVYAGIKKDLVLSSAVNIIEVWDKTKYEEAVKGALNGFADLAEEVMGGDDGDD
jgi:MraZ protein